MKNFLALKDQIPFSAYITDKQPSAITTNGALTIIDNSTRSENIDNLVPYSYCIFLDQQFLASGYGFYSYEQYHDAAYIVNSYNGVYTYIMNELDILHHKRFKLEYTYETSENKIDKVYNTYGWLKEYKEIKISQDETDENTYIFKLNTVHKSYIGDITMSIIGGHESGGANRPGNNYFAIGETAQVKVTFTKDISSTNETNKKAFKDTAPEIYFCNEQIDLNSDNISIEDNSTPLDNDKNQDNNTKGEEEVNLPSLENMIQYNN